MVRVVVSQHTGHRVTRVFLCGLCFCPLLPSCVCCLVSEQIRDECAAGPDEK